MEKVAMKDELERGYGFAKQLGRLILKYSDGREEDDDDDSSKTTSYAEDLAAKVVDSFTKTILLFNNIQHSHRVSADSACDSPANNSDECRHESSDKSKSTTMINKYERTCSSQKRKSTRTRTWEEDSKISPKKDEYAWRKYGRKNILNAKYPRNYFRCSYKYEKGCEATKQVQRIQEDPPLFKTTYFSHHTCSNPHMFDNYNDLSTSSIMISFHNTHNNNTAFDLQKNNTINYLSSMTFPSSIEENKNNNNNNNNDVPSSSWKDDWLLSPNEVLPFESGDLVDFVNSSAVFHEPGYDPFEIRHNNNNNTNDNDNDNNVPSSSWNDDRLLSPDEVLVAFESDDLVDANSSAVFHDPMSDPFETSSLL